MAYVMTTEAEIQQKTGPGVNATFDTTAMEASELRGVAMMNVFCRYNWVDNKPTNADVLGILSDVASSFVAIEAITFDLSGYTSRNEAEDMINVLRDGLLRNLSILKDSKNQEFIQDNAT